MFVYSSRAAWQSFAWRLSRAAPLLRRGPVPFRQMSSGSVPGSSGENLIYYLLVVGAASAGGFYAYRTITSDKTRYKGRIEDIEQRSTADWKPKPWPPQSSENAEMETEEVAEPSEETKVAATEETEVVSAVETEMQNEKQTVSPVEEKRAKPPVVEKVSDVQDDK